MYKLPASGKVKAVYFSLGTTPSKDPQLDCVQAICNLFASARKTAHVCIYSLTETNIVNAIIQAHQRDVDVQVIVDLTQSKGKAMKAAITRLEEAGVPCKVAKKQKAAMHNKVCIFDWKTVTTGSFNFSKAGAARNDENLIVCEGVELARQFEKYVFERALEYETLNRV